MPADVYQFIRRGVSPRRVSSKVALPAIEKVALELALICFNLRSDQARAFALPVSRQENSRMKFPG
jgi:hypothetical protein